MIRTANETGEIALVCGHDALAVGLSGLGWVTSDLPVQVLFSWGWRSAVPGRTGCGTIETALGGPGQARRQHGSVAKTCRETAGR